MDTIYESYKQSIKEAYVPTIKVTGSVEDEPVFIDAYPDTGTITIKSAPGKMVEIHVSELDGVIKGLQKMQKKM